MCERHAAPSHDLGSEALIAEENTGLGSFRDAISEAFTLVCIKGFVFDRAWARKEDPKCSILKKKASTGENK